MLSGDHAASAAAPAFLERRLIRDAQRGDRTAQARLLDRYEPMARRIALAHFLPGGERDDLAQHARLGIVCAMRVWDPSRRVPFSSLAWLCALRETRRAVSIARAGKHQPVTGARSLHQVDGENVHALEDMLEATGRPDADPVAKALARERLREILACVRTLTELERRRARAVGQRLQSSRLRCKARRGGEGGRQRAPARATQAARAAGGLTRPGIDDGSLRCTTRFAQQGPWSLRFPARTSAMAMCRRSSGLDCFCGVASAPLVTPTSSPRPPLFSARLRTCDTGRR